MLGILGMPHSLLNAVFFLLLALRRMKEQSDLKFEQIWRKADAYYEIFVNAGLLGLSMPRSLLNAMFFYNQQITSIFSHCL